MVKIKGWQMIPLLSRWSPFLGGHVNVFFLGGWGGVFFCFWICLGIKQTNRLKINFAISNP